MWPVPPDASREGESGGRLPHVLEIVGQQTRSEGGDTLGRISGRRSADLIIVRRTILQSCRVGELPRAERILGEQIHWLVKQILGADGQRMTAKRNRKILGNFERILVEGVSLGRSLGPKDDSGRA